MSRDARLIWNADGTAHFVDEHGVALPDVAPMSLTARQLADLIASHVETARVSAAKMLLAERKAHAAQLQQTAQAVADKVYTSAVKATAEAVAPVAHEAGVKAERDRLAAETTIRRVVERDESGQITGTHEERIPAADAPPPKKGRPIGFRP